MQTAYSKPHVPTRRRKSHETSLQKQVCRYLRLQYPNLMFRSDGGGLPLSQTQAAIFKSQQSDSGWPDLTIFKPSRGYHALMIELKKDGTTVYLKSGSRKGKLSTNPHIQNQAATLNKLNEQGYYACFGVGFDDTVKIIDWYLCNENTELF